MEKDGSFTAIYVSAQKDGKKEIRNEIQKIFLNMNHGWLIGDDFNDLMSATEKRGGGHVPDRRCNLFKNRIDECNIMCWVGIWNRETVLKGVNRTFSKFD